MSYILSIDAGTSGTLALLISPDGEQSWSAYQMNRVFYPRADFVEQNFEDLWDSVCKTIREVLTLSHVRPEEIPCLSLASQRGAFSCVDAKGEALCPALLWNDRRALAEVSLIEEKVGKKAYEEATGVPLSGIWAFPKMLWLKKNRPEIYEKTKFFVNAQEYLLRKLTDCDFFTERSSMAQTGLLSKDQKKWEGNIIRKTGLDFEKFSELRYAGECVGVISSGAARATGLSVSTKAYTGAGDQQCASLGTGAIRPKIMNLTIGTGSVAIMPASEPVKSPSKLILSSSAIKGQRMCEGILLSAGSSLEWMKKNTNSEGVFFDDSMPPGSENLVFFPWLSGALTPYYKDRMNASLQGLTLLHEKKHWINAAYEGVSFALKEIVEQFGKEGQDFSKIRVNGGGTKDGKWMRALASVMGRELEIPKFPEATALGAAMIAGVGEGIYASWGEATSALVFIKEKVEPEKTLSLAYEEAYNRYKKNLEDLNWGEGS